MHKKPEPQSALSLGYFNTPPKLDEVTLAWESVTPSCSIEKSLTKSFAPRNYPHSPEQIAEELEVDTNGHLWWKRQIKSKGRPRIMNRPVGRLSDRGYLKMWYKERCYEAHVVAFCLYHNRWPLSNMDIDHLNGIKSDNRKENLKEVSHGENGRNWNKLSQRNKSGHNGVNWNAQYRRWRATIQIDGRQMHKHFSSKEEAIACRADWENEFNVTTVKPGTPFEDAIRL